MAGVLRVFISYTTELREQDTGLSWVDAATHAVSARRNAAVEMRLFGSDPKSPPQVCQNEVAACQVWVGILGHRYGSSPPGASVSYTEMEYEVARDHNLARLVYVIDDDAQVSRRDPPDSADAARQAKFRERVHNDGTLVTIVRSPAEVLADLLVKLASSSLQAPPPEARNRPPRYFPVDVPEHHADAKELCRRLLAHDDRVVALIGHGGSGKTSLVWSVFENLLKDRSSEAFGMLDYMSASGHLWITGATVLNRLKDLVRSPSARAGLEARWENDRTTRTWYERIDDVLQAMDENVLLVLDDAQDLLDDADRFVDHSLGQLVTALSHRDNHHVTLLLVSRRPPAPSIVGPWASTVLALESALPDDESAVALLGEFAGGSPGGLGIDRARVVEVLGRRPRLLELFVAVSVLRRQAPEAPSAGGAVRVADGDSPASSLSALLAHVEQARRGLSVEAGHDPGGWDDPAAPILIAALVDQLRKSDVGVLLALAVLGLPARAWDVSQVLGVPTSEQEVRGTLDRLRALRIVRQTHTGQGPGDEDHFQLPVDDADAVVALMARLGAHDALHHLRDGAADHYAGSRPRWDSESLDGLAARFREIHLRLELGLQLDGREPVCDALDTHSGFADRQLQEAVLLMNDLATRHLRASGRRHLLSPLRRRLLEWRGHELWISNISQLVAEAEEVDRPDEAYGLLTRLLAELDARPTPTDPDVRRRLTGDRLTLLSQLGEAAFYDGRSAEAAEHYQAELDATTAPGIEIVSPEVVEMSRIRANLGLTICRMDLGEVDSAEESLRQAQAHAESARGAQLPDFDTSVLREIARAELARIRGSYDTAASILEQAARVVRVIEPEDADRSLVRLLDLQAMVQLDRSFADPPSGREAFASALRAASESATLAAQSGMVDIRRTAHTTLAFVHLRRDEHDDLEHARRAALSAASFHAGRRGLLGYVALGAVRLRDRRHPASEERARECFHRALRMADRFPERGRPYWVWDLVGEAETGLHLCRVRDAELRAVEAFRRARVLVPHRGAARRAAMFVDTLSKGSRPGTTSGILPAALGDPSG